jgi:hypothetical protein
LALVPTEPRVLWVTRAFLAGLSDRGVKLIHSPPSRINKTDLREIGWDGMDWIDLAQDRDKWRALVNTVMNLRVP